MKNLLLDISCLEPLFDEFLSRNRANGSQEVVVRDVVEGASDIGIEHPFLGLVGSSQDVDFLDGIVTTSTWSKPVTRSLEFGFPSRFEGVLDHSLKAAINHDGHPHSTLPHHPHEFRDAVPTRILIIHSMVRS